MTETIAIIDYGSGNLRSATKAFERAASEAGLDARIALTDDPEVVRTADRVVLPGVGAYADCRAGLDAVAGMAEALREAVERRAVPFLGICVGMQLMADAGDEMGTHAGLGWVRGRVSRIDAAPPAKVPHMGWNDVVPTTGHPLLVPGEAYFLHSYAFTGDDVLAITDHAGPVTAAIGRDNMLGVQFHPEKSQAYGLALLKRFLAWKP